jgi:Tfp pilus assembly PilM family ATPase
LTAGTSNFIPFISANVVLTEGDLKEQLNGNLNSYKTYSANEVSLDANFSTKGSSI